MLFFLFFRSDEFEGLCLEIAVGNQLKEKRYDGFRVIFAPKLIKKNQFLGVFFPLVNFAANLPFFQVLDCRDVGTAEEMFKAMCDHLDYATNEGKLR